MTKTFTGYLIKTPNRLDSPSHWIFRALNNVMLSHYIDIPKQFENKLNGKMKAKAVIQRDNQQNYTLIKVL